MGASAAQCLEVDASSEIHVTLAAGEPYMSWNVQKMAKLDGLLRCDRTVPFVAERYAGYQHRRTKGDAYAEARGLSEHNVVQGAKTYVFRLSRNALAEHSMPIAATTRGQRADNTAVEAAS